MLNKFYIIEFIYNKTKIEREKRSWLKVYQLFDDGIFSFGI